MGVVPAAVLIVLREVDAILRARGRLGPGHGDLPRWTTLAAVAAGSILYGLVMGAYTLRPLQMAYSAAKVPLLVAASAAICLPNLVVINTVLGLREDFGAVLRGLTMAQGTVCVSLAALAPVTGFVYLSSTSYNLAVLYNGASFLVAALAGQVTLARHYRPLIDANPKHRLARNAWLGLYVFVAIQMAWLLRPFVGDPGQQTRFFREGAWGNAYVEVARIVWRAWH